MYEAPGIGLAAPQVGVQKRLFVYDIGDGTGPHTVINPVLSTARGEWAYEEGCLSVPGLYWPIVRPAKEVHLDGLRPRRQRDLGRGRRAPGADVPARVDHLDGVLLLERLTRSSARRRCGSCADASRSDPSTTLSRLAFLGTPAAAVPFLAGWSTPATTSLLSSPAADKRRGRGTAWCRAR